MKKSKFSDGQIMSILKQAENGVPVAELYRQHGMSSASFYKWRAKYGGMDASMMSELKAMAEENRRLKRMYAEMVISPNLMGLSHRPHAAVFSFIAGVWLEPQARLSDLLRAEVEPKDQTTHAIGASAP